MRFDFQAYGKVFPSQTVPQTVDTAVEGFNPTAEKAAEMAKDDMPGEPDPMPEQEQGAPIVAEEAPPEGE